MDIQHKLKINASADTIYKAVSTQKGITAWWSKDCSVGENIGEPSNLKFDKQGNIVEMGFKTIALEPNTLVKWQCVANPNPAWINTEVITQISSSEIGCNVVFTHGGFDEKWKGQDPFEMTKQGWEHFVASLVSYCEKGEGQPW